MKWFLIFQSLAKLSPWIVKPDFWSQTPKYLVWFLTTNIGDQFSKLQVMGRELSGELQGWLHLWGGHILVPFHSSCPFPSALYPSSPRPPLLSFSSSYHSRWVGEDTVMVGKQEESLVKTTPEPFSQALVMKGLNEPQQFPTGKFWPVSWQARHWATLNGAGLKFRISDLSKASAWIERLGHGHSCGSE